MCSFGCLFQAWWVRVWFINRECTGDFYVLCSPHQVFLGSFTVYLQFIKGLFFLFELPFWVFLCFQTRVSFFWGRKVFRCCDSCYGVPCLYFTLWISQLEHKRARVALKEDFDKNPALSLPLSSMWGNGRPFSQLKFKENIFETAEFFILGTGQWYFFLYSQ